MSTRTTLSVRLCAIATVAGILSTAVSAQTVYTGPTNGSWTDPLNWSTGVPSSALNAVVNGNLSSVNVNLGPNLTGNANTLSIDVGDSVTVNNNSTLNLAGNLVAGGLLRFNVGANESYLNFSSATASINGTIDFNYQTGAAAAGAIQGPGSGTLTNNGIVRGSGSLRNIRFTNAVGGVLENYQSDAQLYLDANNGAAGLFVNLGTIRALAGSTVTFAGDFGGDFISTGGAIQANGDGAVVRLINSAGITGGTYSTTGTGEVVAEANHTVSMSSFINTGMLRVRNNSRINVSGVITNTGTLEVNPVGSTSYVSLVGDTTLAGTGTVRLNSTAAADARIDGGGVLTIGANQTVRGAGYFREMRVINNGTIIGEGTNSPQGGMYLDSSNTAAGQFVNNGTIQAAANSYVSLVGDFGGTFTGSGVYRADGVNAFLHLANSVTVDGGLYTTTGGGEIRVPVNHLARMNAPTITNNSIVRVLNNSRLYLNGSVVNNGLLQVDSGASESYLTIESDVSLSGTGQTVLISNPGVSSARVDGGGTLTIATGHVVRGNGYLREMRVINNGTLLADQATGSLYLDPSNGAADLFVNNATVRAAAGATVHLVGDFGGNFAGPGTYRADGAGASLNLINSVTVNGGVFTTTGGGVVQVPVNQTATILDSTVSAGSVFDVANNARLNLNGSPIFNGLMRVTSGANESYLTINGTTNLSVGTLQLLSNAGVSNARVDGSGVLNIGPNFTVTGNGYFREMRVNNSGTIQADQATASMYLDPSNTAADLFVNTGTIKALAGATVNLAGDFGGNFAGNGIYRADGTGARVQLVNSVTVNGGNYATSAGGVIAVPLNQTARMNNPTIAANANVATENNSRLYVNGSVTNNGSLTVGAGINTSLLTIESDTTFSGSGTTTLSSAAADARIDGGGILTIAPGHTVAGNGYFREMRVVNNGTILANVNGGTMTLDPSNTAANLFVNNGTIRATSGGTIGLAGDFGGNFTGTGPLVVDANSSIVSYNSIGGNLGPMTGAGKYIADSSAQISIQSLRVGAVEGKNSGVARITAGGGNVGTSKIGTISFTNGGRMDVTDHGLIVTGMTQAAVRSIIAPARNNGQWNGANGIGSSLANGNGKAVGYALASDLFNAPGLFLGQSFALSDVLVRYTFNGDTDLNGQVNFDDLLRLAQNYDTVGTGTWRNGDSTYDGNINFDDLLALAQQYGQSLALAGGEMSILSSVAGESFVSDWAMAVSMVPEPASLSLLAMAGVVVRRRRLV